MHVEPRKFPVWIQLNRASITLSNHKVFILFPLKLIQKFDKSRKAAKQIFFTQQFSDHFFDDCYLLGYPGQRIRSDPISRQNPIGFRVVGRHSDP
jgi:hypothetical protein